MDNNLSSPSPSNIIYYCKDCAQVVDTNRVGRKYVYTCKKCGTKNVAFGTVKSINSFFRIKETQPEPEIKEEKKSAIDNTNNTAK